MMYFQTNVGGWLVKCLGETIFRDKIERNHRFLEESLELVQACGMSRAEAIQLVDYVFDRPAGKIEQEVGGASITLNALCECWGVDRYVQERIELDRCWKNMGLIQSKQKLKPKHLGESSVLKGTD